jgi:EF hand
VVKRKSKDNGCMADSRGRLTNEFVNAKLVHPQLYHLCFPFQDLSIMNSVETPAKVAKRSSLPVLIGVVVVAVGLYFGIPYVLQNMMVLDEQAKAKAKLAESLILNTSTEVEPTSGVKKMPLGASAGGGGASGGPTGDSRSGGERPDPEEAFKSRDKDGNGKLEGAEISERMQGRMDQIDKDSDGAVSKEEFLAALQARQANATPAAGEPTKE